MPAPIEPRHPGLTTGRNVWNIILCNLLGLIIAGARHDILTPSQSVSQSVRGFPQQPRPARRSSVS